MVENIVKGSTVNKIRSVRLDWVDCAKGLCIILVVMMHATLSVEETMGREGVMYFLVAFAKPFRMPDFFLMSGLFLSRVIHLNWRTYLDRKVIHFAYFYVLWVTINFAIKSPELVQDHGGAGAIALYLESFIQPFGTLWFIYLLPIFFVVTKVLCRVRPIFVFVVAAALEIVTINTGWIVIDHFAARFVYFFTGYWLAPQIFTLASAAQRKTLYATIGLIIWAFINGALVFAGYADLPFVSLSLGFVGAAAIVTTATLLTKIKLGEAVRYCGEHSIVIYLAFVLPLNAGLFVLIETGFIPYAGLVAFILTIIGVFGALTIWWLVRETRLSFLFERPRRFYFDTLPSAITEAKTGRHISDKRIEKQTLQ